ncbi:MAG: hypothetical protein NE327_20165 [Lentisphaeraceae bacterium]|nr:hypothetical protein [Lentisphaeraceae bacterium]
MINKLLITLFVFSISLFGNDKPTSPGSHKKNKCDSGSKYTFDVYIPKAYAEKSDKQFPVLYISSPGANPGFMKLEKWAEETEFLLITINESKNGLDWKVIFQIQDDVVRSTEYLRKHHALQFATGFSGSAWASVHLANRHPKKIAGVFMNCHSGNGTVLQDKDQSVALVSGNTDKIHSASAVVGAYNGYRKRGFHTQYENLEMGHTWAPLDKFVENLNFLYNYQKFANKHLTDEEVNEAYSQLEKEELVAIAKLNNKNEAMSKLESFMGIPKLMKSSLANKIYSEWGNAALSYVNDQKDSDPAAAYFAMTSESSEDIIKKLPSQIKSSLVQEVRNLSRKKEVVDEINADKKFSYFDRQLSRARNKKSAIKLIPKLEKFMEEFSGTKAADKAKEAIKKINGMK